MSWPSSYLEASFRGVAFECLSTAPEISRATVAHSYPFRDGAEIEDLGLQARRHTVKAMLFGLNADAALQQLEAALTAPGAGELSHPIYGRLTVVVESYHPVFDADNTDSVALDIVFTETARESRTFTLEIPQAKINALTLAIEDVYAAAGESFVKKLLELLSILRTHEATQLAETIDLALAHVASISHVPQNVAQSYLALPAFFLPDVRGMMNALIPSVAGVAPFEQAQRQLAQASFLTPRPADAHAALIAVNVQLLATLALLEAAQAVLSSELAQPQATPPQIEALTNAARTQVQASITALSVLYPLELSRPVSEALKNCALLLQQLATLVIETRPPLLSLPAPLAGNYRLLAHALYADHERAPELARLNPAIRHPNFIRQGEPINAFAR